MASDESTEQMKQQIEAEMRKHGLWRDDIEPVWIISGDGLTCTFPNFWDVPLQERK